jgi:hypothetical protein
MMFSVPESYAIEKSRCRVESLLSDNYVDPMKLRGGTWFEPLLSMAVSKNNYYLNFIITWYVCKCKRNWKQRAGVYPGRPALPCPCPCPVYNWNQWASVCPGRPALPCSCRPTLPLFVRQTAPALPHVPKQIDPSFLETWNEKVWVFFGIWVSRPGRTDRQTDKQTNKHCSFNILDVEYEFSTIKKNVTWLFIFL